MPQEKKPLAQRAVVFTMRGWAAVVMVALLLVGVGYYAYWDIVLHRFAAVTRYQLYQSGQMPPDQLLDVTAKHRIRSVIDLRLTADDGAAIAAESDALDGSDVAYFHLPTGHVPSEETVLKFLEIVGDPSNRPALVHCHHGTGRSVLFASIFRVEFENWDNETARRAVEPLHWRGNFGPDSVKGKYLISYEPHHARLVFAADN